jgi:hypothetical protein
MVDTHASKACDCKVMRVRVPLPALMSVHNKNTSVFDWTPELAYVVGLLATDGNLSKDGRHITMRSSDKDLLHTFNKCLAIKNKIALSTANSFAKKPCYRLQFGNVKFYNWLRTIGLHPAKTHTIAEIIIPDQYFKDFLRGHLDGDGTILTYQDQFNSYRGRIYTHQRVYIKFISVSEIHIRWLHNKILTLADVKGSLTRTVPATQNKVPMWTIKFSKRESLKLLPWLYYKKALPSLERKRLLADWILQTVPNIKRKKYNKIVV